MPLDRALAAKARRHDQEPVVSAAARRAGVAGVERAFVDEIERLGFERGEPFADRPRDVGHGFSSTYFARNRPCASTNSSIRPMPPNSLKFTHASVEKVYATYRFAAPMNTKNAIQLQFSLRHA